MALIIGFGNRKGGTGKTSSVNALACHLAYSGLYPGYKIAGIDLDNMMSWSDMRDDDMDDLESLVQEGRMTPEKLTQITDRMFDLFHEPVTSFPDKIEQYDDEYDILLLDLPGTLDQEGVIDVYKFVDRLVIPTDLTRQDVNGTVDFVNNIVQEVFPVRKKAFPDKPNLPFTGLLTKIDVQTNAFKDRVADLHENSLKEEFGFEFVKEPITQSKAVFGQYANTYDVLRNGSGKVVFEPVFLELVERLGINKIEIVGA